VSFPLDLDLAPYVADECREQAAPFHLAGFVVHSGTLESGHYISPVRGSSSWTLFNDARVTELDEDGARRIGLGQAGPRTSYPLFYLREDFVNDGEQPQLPAALREAIVAEGRTSAKQRFFCSLPYCELMATLPVRMPEREDMSPLYIPRVRLIGCSHSIESFSVP
jgi:hypothetical protein